MSSASHPGGKPRSRGIDLDEYTEDTASLRRLVRQSLDGMSDDDLDDVLPVITELVSNAFDHGRAARWMRLYVTPTPYVVRCEVDDTAVETPVLGRSRLEGSRGRGMVLVNHLATEWGVSPGDGFKTVWAELHFPLTSGTMCRPQVTI